MAPSTSRDYYQVLGVPRDASDKDIRAAYRRLARKYHPDLNPGDRGAEGRFKELQGAYDVLSDPEKRKKYDRFGPNWEDVERARAAGYPGGFGPRSTGDIHVDFGEGGDLSDLFGDLLGGRSGSGTRNRAGFRTRSRVGEDLDFQADISLEEAYQGATRVITIPASSGTSRSIEVRIPPGVKTGARVRLAGQGGPGVGGGAAGDL